MAERALYQSPEWNSQKLGLWLKEPTHEGVVLLDPPRAPSPAASEEGEAGAADGEGVGEFGPDPLAQGTRTTGAATTSSSTVRGSTTTSVTTVSYAGEGSEPQGASSSTLANEDSEPEE